MKVLLYVNRTVYYDSMSTITWVIINKENDSWPNKDKQTIDR